jgi:hypothetical protein
MKSSGVFSRKRYKKKVHILNQFLDCSKENTTRGGASAKVYGLGKGPRKDGAANTA